MGKEWEAQIFGARLGMTALALLAAVTAIAIAVMAGGQLRAAFLDATGSEKAGASVGALEYRAGE